METWGMKFVSMAIQLLCAVGWIMKIGLSQGFNAQALGAMTVLALPYVAFALFTKNETNLGQIIILVFSLLATAVAVYLGQLDGIDKGPLPFIQGLVLLGSIGALYGAWRVAVELGLKED